MNVKGKNKAVEMSKDFEAGRRIKALRGSLTQAEFAKRLKVTQPMVSAWEAGCELPSSADLWIRLGRIAGWPGCFWFWNRAGFDLPGLMAAVQKEFRKELSAVNLGLEDSLVPVQPFEPRLEAEAPPEAIPFLALFAPYPLTTRYFVVGEQSRGYGFERGDILLLDVSDAGSHTLSPFWGQLVLLEWTDPAEGAYREQIVGRVFPKAYGRDTLRSSEHPSIVCMGCLQPWNSLPHQAGGRTATDLKAYERGDRLKDSGPFLISVTVSESVKGRQDDLEAAFDERYERIRMRVSLLDECRILGRVTGWFPAPTRLAR